MGENDLKPYRLDTTLTGYMPIPRSLLAMGLPSTAVLLYAVLLDRATLSQRNHYADSGGWVYVIYPIEHLAQALQVCPSVVKKHLKCLEDAHLIRRTRPSGNGASYIYLNVPTGSIKKPSADANAAPGSANSSRPRGKKAAPNNMRNQQILTDNYYQFGEDESL